MGGRRRLFTRLRAGGRFALQICSVISTNGQGILAQELGEFAVSRSCLEASLEIKRELKDRHGEATSLANLGFCAYLQDEINDARTYMSEALALLGDISDDHLLARSVLNNLGGVTRLQGDLAGARTLLERSLDMRITMGDRKSLAYSFGEFANLAESEGDLDRATQLHAFASELFAKVNYKLSVAEQRRLASLVERLRSNMGDERFNSQRLRGLAEDVDQAALVVKGEITSSTDKTS